MRDVAPVVAPVAAEPPRADKGRGRKNGTPVVTAETREFWETWADEKSTRAAEPVRADDRDDEERPAPRRSTRDDRPARTERDDRPARTERDDRPGPHRAR